MKLDLHNHTVYSPDSATTIRDAVSMALRAGLDGIAVTDHNSVSGSLEAVRLAEGRLIVLTGSEISTSEGHLLCLGIGEDIRKGLPMSETAEIAVSLGGIAVPSHPFRLGTGAGIKVLKALKVPAIETVNGRNPHSRNRRAEMYARAASLGSTGGSDSHAPDEIGRAYTEIEGDGMRAGDVIELIAKGASRGAGSGQGIAGSAKIFYKIASEYFKRGRKHI